MLNYLLRRMFFGVITLLLITMVVYGLMRLMPGSPLVVAQAEMDPSRRQNPADIERMKKAYGLDLPIPVAYGKWLADLVQGDMGISFRYKRPVTRVIRERVGPTLLLSVTSAVVVYLLAIPMGLWSTVHSGKLRERVPSVFMYMLYSFPTFVAALLLQLMFAVRWEILPLFEMRSQGFENLSYWDQVKDLFWHMVLPVTCLSYGSLAYFSRFIRSNMLEVMRQDYIRTARAKGVPAHRVLFVHAFRNSLIPLVTMLGFEIGALLAGAVIVEQIFSWPGMGRLFLDSIVSRDYPLIMALVLIFAFLNIVGTMVADVLYAVVDPRVSYS